MAPSTRWLFGDQLGPHFLDDDQQQVLVVESRAVFRRRRFHRAKAHLVLSAMRHRAAELGDRVRYVRADTYAEALDQYSGPLEVVHPTTRGALALVERLGDRVELLPARGFVTSAADFAAWTDSRAGRRLRLEDFYRDVRRRTGLLMDGDQPVGGRWNFDTDNRLPPPKGTKTLGVAEPWWPEEDEIDDQVRFDLDRWQKDGVEFLGADGPRRFAASRGELEKALTHFLDHRLGAFGPYEDAMLSGDPWMSHSLLSAPMNLGLVDPLEVALAAQRTFDEGAAPLASVEGFIRQVVGWRDYTWHMYWWLGEDYRYRNALSASRPLPAWFAELDVDSVDASCLRGVLGHVHDYGWAHHIERLMVLGNWAMQRGYDPAQLSDWFRRVFVDGYEWVMVTNVVGMSQFADGGVVATKPYAGGGAYIHRMSNYCQECRYRPSARVGADACPFTAGYWAFLDRNRETLATNHRMRQPLAGLRRLADREVVVAQEEARGDRAP